MQAILEIIAAVVVWMAVATLNQLGVEVELPKAEPREERVIQRDAAAPKLRPTGCPEEERRQKANAAHA